MSYSQCTDDDDDDYCVHFWSMMLMLMMIFLMMMMIFSGDHVRSRHEHKEMLCFWNRAQLKSTQRNWHETDQISETSAYWNLEKFIWATTHSGKQRGIHLRDGLIQSIWCWQRKTNTHASKIDNCCQIETHNLWLPQSVIQLSLGWITVAICDPSGLGSGWSANLPCQFQLVARCYNACLRKLCIPSQIRPWV